VLDKKLAQFDVVNEPSGAGELVPCVGPVGGPVPADRLRLGGLDRAGRESGLALGDMGPDEGGCLLPLAVVEDWLDRSWDWRQATGEFVPVFRVEAPFLHDVAAVGSGSVWMLILIQQDGTVPAAGTVPPFEAAGLARRCR